MSDSGTSVDAVSTNSDAMPRASGSITSSRNATPSGSDAGSNSGGEEPDDSAPETSDEEDESTSSVHLESLRAAIKNKPYCSGTVKISPQQAILFYGKVDDAHCLDFATATSDRLANLSRACEAATFGKNGQNVLDESYRKAGKLDLEHFSATFDLGKSGLLDVVKGELTNGDKPIKAELYKLNVYGE